MWVKEALPFLLSFWFTWLYFGGRDNGVGFDIDNLLPSFWIWFGVTIFLWIEIFHLGHQWLLGATFFGVVPRDFMVFTPFFYVLLQLFITLLVLRLGLVVVRVAIFSLSLVLWVGVTFTLLWMWGVYRPKLSPLMLKFMLDLENISISRTQWCDVQKILLCLNVSMRTTAVFEN